MKWKAGDWCIFDMRVGQITEISKDGYPRFSDGQIETSGGILDHFRPLTLRNKSIIESFDYYYNEIRKLDGSGGFNFPDIHSYFSKLSCDAIDNEDNKKMFDKAQEFVREARDYKKVIQGIRLFRPH